MTSTGRINYIDELKGFILCLVCLRTYCLFRTFLCYELDVSYENVYFLFPIRIIILTKTISNI